MAHTATRFLKKLQLFHRKRIAIARCASYKTTALRAPSNRKKRPDTEEDDNRTLQFTEFDEGVSINYGAESRQLLFHWLRDHCRAESSYNHQTHQKITLPHHIDANIKPKSVSVQDNQLVVSWPEGIHSRFDPEWLLVNSYPGVEERIPKFIWDDAAMTRERVEPISYERLMSEKAGLKEFLSTLLKYGFAIVRGVLDENWRADISTTKTVVQRVCDIQPTQLFGEFWSFTNDNALSDTAWTNTALGAHTDTTYFSIPAGIQVFHCLHHDGRGGDTRLVDGFHAAETLRDQDPQGFAALTQLKVEHEYIESLHGRISGAPQAHVRSLDTILRTHPVTEDLEWIRYNPYDRAAIRTVPPQKLKTFYRALSMLSRKIESPKREHWIKLKPGMVLFVDNWRVLHGRSAFTGKREVCGCYLSRDDWMSRARCLGLIQ